MSDLVVGEQFDDYRLLKFLGGGHFGQVYLAEHISQGTQVAIKVLDIRPTSDIQKAREEFQNEARALQWIHPNIIRMRDAGIRNGRYYLVMDYAPQGNLRMRHPIGEQLTWKTVANYVHQIADALQYVHDQDKVHRDVKPENLLIGANGEILLSDFGLTITPYTLDPEQLQQAQGTLMYIAPEQLEMHAARESDQYSLGVLMFEWLTGKPPFEGFGVALAYKHKHVNPPSLRTLVPSISPQVEAIVMKLLAKNPRERFKNMRELLSELDSLQTRPQSLKPLIFRGHSDSIRTVAWSPNGLYIASAGRDKTVHIWEAATGKVIYTYTQHTGEIWSVAWSPDSQHIASVGADKTLYVWKATTGDAIATYHGHTRTIHTVAWSADGACLATASDDETVRVWKPGASTGSPVRIYRQHHCWVYAVAWSPNSRYLASGGEDGRVHIWDATTGARLHSCKGHTDRVMSVSWSPDGEYVASGSDDCSISVWQAAAGEQRQKFIGHALTVAGIAWLPDPHKHLLASASWDKTMLLWSMNSQQPLARYAGHEAWVTSLCWYPGGNFIVSGSWDQTVRTWDMET